MMAYQAGMEHSRSFEAFKRSREEPGMSMGLEGARPPNKISSSHSKISPISRPAVWRVSRKKNQTNPRRTNLAPTLNLRSPIPPRTFDRLRGRPRARPEAPAFGVDAAAAQAIRRRRVAPRHQKRGAKDDHAAHERGGFDARECCESPPEVPPVPQAPAGMQREHDGELAEPRGRRERRRQRGGFRRRRRGWR